MMGKKRILMCAESSHVDSGFGNYTKSILSKLHATNKYEIAELSAYRTINVPKKEPWKIYANAPTDPEALKQYGSNPSNAFGAWGFERACIDFKPDIVFDIRDYWMSSFVEMSPLRPYFHWMIGPTIDSAPQKTDWLQTFSSADTVSAHTQWGVDYLKSTGVPMNLVEPVNDAVNIDVFAPSKEPKEMLKQQLGLSPSDFVIGSVMRNQKRKLIPNLIKIIKEVSRSAPNAKLYLHTSYPDLNAWNLPDLLMYYDAMSLVYFTYKCQACKKYYASTFHEHPTGCKHCNQKACGMCTVSNGLEDKDLAKVINSFDVYVQYAICEGFGIPPVEAAACGIPVVTVDHGAMREVGDNIGADIVPVASYFRELETNADRVYPDDDKCIDILVKKYNELKDLSFIKRMSQTENLRNKLTSSYDWNKTAEAFERIFDNIQLTGLQGKWDAKPALPQPEVKVPPLPSNRKVLNFIADHVINAPHIKHTAIFQNIVHSADVGYVAANGNVRPFTMDNAIKSLEGFMNSKTIWEKVRVGEIDPPEMMNHVVQYA